MNPLQKAVAAVAIAGSTLAGGAIGAALFTGTSATAATTSTTATPAATAPATAPATPGSAPAAAAPGGTFHSNENAAHETTESAQREAQETAGQFPTVP